MGKRDVRGGHTGGRVEMSKVREAARARFEKLRLLCVSRALQVRPSNILTTWPSDANENMCQVAPTIRGLGYAWSTSFEAQSSWAFWSSLLFAQDKTT